MEVLKVVVAYVSGWSAQCQRVNVLETRETKNKNKKLALPTLK